MRHAVEKAVLVIFEGYAVFHHGLFHTLTLLVGLSVAHLVGVKFGPQTDKLGDGLTAGLLLHSEDLFVRTSDRMAFRVVAGFEPFGNILSDVLVKVLRLDSVTEGVRVRE